MVAIRVGFTSAMSAAQRSIWRSANATVAPTPMGARIPAPRSNMWLIGSTERTVSSVVIGMAWMMAWNE